MKNIEWKNVLTLCITAVFCFVLLNIGTVVSAVQNIVSALYPFIWGIIFAVLLSNTAERFEKRIFSRSKHARLFASLCAVLYGIAIVLLFLVIVYPKIGESVKQLIASIPTDESSLRELVRSTYGKININIETEEEIVSFAVQQTEKIFVFIEENAAVIVTGISSFAGKVFDMIIGVLVSFYILNDRDKISNAFRNTVLSVFRKGGKAINEWCSVFITKTKDFLSGKALDSFIIGVLCFIYCLASGTEYSVLISLIVGVTNMIPFFGPFIGAIPCALILLFADTGKFLPFIIFVFILQQLDGNVIGPKILGKTLNVPVLWLLFAELLCGGLFGVTGLILSNPAIATVYEICYTRKNREW